MSSRVDAFEHWIRTAFVRMNTELEELYYAQADRARVQDVGGEIKAALRDEGHVHVVGLLAEGNTGDGFDIAFARARQRGMYLGALRRHELTNPAARGTVAVSRGLLTRAARRRLARHGAAVLDGASGDP